jgi:hypothetical protein
LQSFAQQFGFRQVRPQLIFKISEVHKKLRRWCTTLLDGRRRTRMIGSVANFLLTVMKSRIANGLIALGCVLLASCYPYNENAGKLQKTKPLEKIAGVADQQKTKSERDLMKKKSEMKKAAGANDSSEETKPEATNPSMPEKTPTEKPKTGAAAAEKPNYKVANKIPGKDGFVFSPWNNKVVDVRDIPTGTLVQDPTYPASEKKYFRVP